MKGCLSLLLALIVLAALLAAGYWFYTDMKGRTAAGGGSGATLTLTNETAYPLSITLKKDNDSERVQVGPGKTAKRPMAPGTYQVRGTISDADTSEFAGEWTIERGMNYTARFVRTGEGGAGGVRLLEIRAAPAAP